MKKVNPQDATRRNIQAANKRIAALRARVVRLERAIRELRKHQKERA